MIPSPTLQSFSIGPITIHLYGIIIALAITTCYAVALKKAKHNSIPTSEIDAYFFTIIPAAFIGARIYHVLTNWDFYSKNTSLIPAIWNGGIGILGGVIAGLLTTIFLTKRYSRKYFFITDFIAPLIALGQSIGRWGNYVNQELFGKPTTLPWGLYITEPKRPQKYLHNNTFHPTFLYESILNLLNFLVLTFLNRKYKLGTRITTAFYLINYGIIRLLIESVKIDPDTTTTLGILRVPQYISIGLITLGIIILLHKKHI